MGGPWEHVAAELAAAGATVHVRAGSALQRVAGRARVRRVLLADETLHADALVWAPEPTPAYELPRQVGIPCTYRDDLGAFVPESLANGLTEVAGVYLAGSVTGMGAAHTLAGVDEVTDTVCAQLRDHAA